MISILCQFCKKNGLALGIFRQFLCKNFCVNFQKKLVQILYKFQLIWTKIEGADMFEVKYFKMSILYFL